jgi:hypothetical protein
MYMCMCVCAVFRLDLLVCVAPRPGSFEVTLEDGTLLYSSLQAKKFPTEKEMLTAVEEVRLERSPSSGGGCS